MKPGRFILLIVLLAAPLHAQYLVTAVPTLTLSMASTSYAGTPMNITWNPIFQQYYGGGGGSPSFTSFVWNASGSQLQTLNPINTDLRAYYFNPANGTMYDVAYSANSQATSTYGYFTVGLSPSGLLTGAYTSTGIVLSGLPSNQVVPAYDAARNLLYAYGGNSVVSVVDPTNGSLVRNVTLTLGTNSAYTYAIAYDPYADALLTVSDTGTMHALAFNASSGALLGSIALPGLVSPDMSYGLGFTNGQLFVYDSSISAYRGYSLVPEPGANALLAVGLVGLVLWQRRRRARD